MLATIKNKNTYSPDLVVPIHPQTGVIYGANTAQDLELWDAFVTDSADQDIPGHMALGMDSHSPTGTIREGQVSTQLRQRGTVVTAHLGKYTTLRVVGECL